MDIRKLQRAIVDGLEDVKGQNILVFNTEHLSPLFEHVIRPDWKVVLVITGVEAGDQVSGVQVNRDRFETGDYGYPTGALDVTDPAHLAAIELANLTA